MGFIYRLAACKESLCTSSDEGYSFLTKGVDGLEIFEMKVMDGMATEVPKTVNKGNEKIQPGMILA
ncbi:hypothetical protein FAZ15_13615 [Sphingobacterium olei]|uniref:Uncharacterized protein n=1 Tax=Sphingobacterium olei TaxID=2571155 RepID=A0A4U0PB91_9SPHI|nr:hypothetical protein [Sphingobacterium olei]TJZ59924.1 hypothetical protein FAZ15_13615 [Sphingobacterium olei]